MLNQQHLAYERYDYGFTQIADWTAAQTQCKKYTLDDWPPLLDALANRLNPILPLIQAAHFGSCYWIMDQWEFATDVLFKDRQMLAILLLDLFEHAILQYSAEDILRFLGRKIHGNIKGEVTSCWKK